jgi:hypothetical protein
MLDWAINVHWGPLRTRHIVGVAGVADENAGGQGSEVVAMQWPISRADFNLDQHIEAVTKMHLRAGPEVE